MRVFTSVYLVLLGYIICALVFWEMALQRQNGQIFAQSIITLQSRVDTLAEPVVYHQEMGKLAATFRSHEKQYLAEGITFLLVTLIGAGVVYRSINRRIMLSRQQNNFMLAVTHELKSPIAAIKLSMQTLQKHQLSEDKRNDLVSRCITEADRLNDLCNNLLLASQLEGRKYKPATEEFNLSDLIEDTVKEYAHRYPRKFEEDIAPACKVTGDKVMLQMAINNIIENAIKYTSDQKPIAISLTTKPGTAVLDIMDQGPGIADAEKKVIFNKFYRIGNEGSRKSKGTGLGLYLTQKIVREHKGKITVKDNKPAGAIFEICLPAHC
jgi:signal transduction histidine kinase